MRRQTLTVILEGFSFAQFFYLPFRLNRGFIITHGRHQKKAAKRTLDGFVVDIEPDHKSGPGNRCPITYPEVRHR